MESVAVDGRHLSVHVHPDADVSLREIERLVERHSPSTKVDTDRLVPGPRTIFQLDAGVCFFCAEGPIGMTLARRSFVKSWSVVDYRERGRLRFRIEPVGEVLAAAMDVESFEDVILPSRYDGLGAPDLYWPTGGVAWRVDETSARHEAAISKKPLMLFPTAGT